MENSAPFNLTDRDIQFINHLCNFGYLTIDHVSKWIFRTSYNRTAARLSALRKKGFIRLIRRCDQAGSYCYIPNFKWVLQYHPELAARAFVAAKRKPWRRFTTEHDDLTREFAEGSGCRISRRVCKCSNAHEK